MIRLSPADLVALRLKFAARQTLAGLVLRCRQCVSVREAVLRARAHNINITCYNLAASSWRVSPLPCVLY